MIAESSQATAPRDADLEQETNRSVSDALPTKPLDRDDGSVSSGRLSSENALPNATPKKPYAPPGDGDLERYDRPTVRPMPVPGGLLPARCPVGNSKPAAPTTSVATIGEGGEVASAKESRTKSKGSPDIDWHALVPDKYNTALPKHTPEELKLLEESLKERGFSGTIYTDERGYVLDGSALTHLCKKLDIEPRVEVIRDLTENEKEMVALDRNACRRQLSEEQSIEVRNQRIYLALAERRMNPKKYTLEKIASTSGCAISTVKKLADLLEDETGFHVDARRKYDDAMKAEAFRMHETGMKVLDIAKQLNMTEKAVRRAIRAHKTAAAEAVENELATNPGIQADEHDDASEDSENEPEYEAADDPMEADEYDDGSGDSGHDPEYHAADDPEYETADDPIEADQHDDLDADELLMSRLLETCEWDESQYARKVEQWNTEAETLLNKCRGGKSGICLLKFLAKEWETSKYRAEAARDLIRQTLNEVAGAGSFSPETPLAGTVLAITPDGVLVELPIGKGLIPYEDSSLWEVGQPGEGDKVQVCVTGPDAGNDRLRLTLVSIIESSPYLFDATSAKTSGSKKKEVTSAGRKSV